MDLSVVENLQHDLSELLDHEGLAPNPQSHTFDSSRMSDMKNAYDVVFDEIGRLTKDDVEANDLFKQGAAIGGEVTVVVFLDGRETEARKVLNDLLDLELPVDLVEEFDAALDDMPQWAALNWARTPLQKPSHIQSLLLLYLLSNLLLHQERRAPIVFDQ